MPGEEPGRKARRGLQGTPADRQSRIRGVRSGMRCWSDAGLRRALSVLFVVVACDAIAQSAPLTVCIAEDNEPLSYVRDGKPRGFDVRIAQAIADELGRPLRIVPFETEYERESTLAREVDALLSSQVCELASGFPLLREDFGVPIGVARTPDFPGAKRFRERPFVTLLQMSPSRPYQGMALVVASRREVARPVKRLSDLSGLRIANVAGTLSSALLVMYQNGMLRRNLVSLPQRGDTVFELMAKGQLDAAVVPAGLYDAWHLHHPDGALVKAEYQRPLGINIGFVATAQGSQALQAANRTIERALERGDLARWAAEEGVSWMRPTEPDVSRAPALHQLASDP
jgi:ABC-type amino acid transport substrate-binding protein